MKRTIYIPLIAAALALTSCEQKDLCFNHREHAPGYNYVVRVDYNPQWQLTYEGGVDWRENWELAHHYDPYEALLPDIPDGLRDLVYNEDNYYDTDNLPTHGGTIGISEGDHELLFFNNDTEYIVFSDFSKAAGVSATTRARARSTYMGSITNRDSDEPETTVNEPDMLYSHYIDHYTGSPSTETQYLDFTMQPLVFRYLVRYHFDYGIQYVRLARGALSGMALYVNLTDGSTPNDKATVLFDVDLDVDKIKANYAAQLEARAAAMAKTPNQSAALDEVGSGTLTTIVNSFGAPGFPNPYYSRVDGTFGLNLEVRLGNGKILNFDYDITDQMAHQPRGGVIDVYGIYISDEEGKEGSGAFDVDVEGWGQHQDIDIFNDNINNSK